VQYALHAPVGLLTRLKGLHTRPGRAAPTSGAMSSKQAAAAAFAYSVVAPEFEFEYATDAGAVTVPSSGRWWSVRTKDFSTTVSLDPVDTRMLGPLKEISQKTRSRLTERIPGVDPLTLTPMQLFLTLFESGRMFDLLLASVNRYLRQAAAGGSGSVAYDRRRVSKPASREEHMDGVMHLLPTGAADGSIADSYNADIAYAPRASSIPQQRMYAIMRALCGVVVDVAGKGGDETAGLDWKLAGDERDEDILEVERLFMRLCGDLFLVRGASPLSADDDALRMNSKSASRDLGLSLTSDPKKGVGPVQTTVHDSLTCIVLSSRCALCGESADDSLLLAIMKLARVEVHSKLTLPIGNILSMDRGYVSESLLELERKGCVQFVCTSTAKASFLFARSDSKVSNAAKKIVAKDKVGHRDRWMQGNGRIYSLANTEATSSKPSCMLTNAPSLGPGRYELVPRRRNKAKGMHVIASAAAAVRAAGDVADTGNDEDEEKEDATTDEDVEEAEAGQDAADDGGVRGYWMRAAQTPRWTAATINL
jgi:hypothetical protein